MQAHQQIFFVLALVVAVPVLIYYYRRTGHRRFRPRVGEMAMVCLFTLMLCGGGAMLMGSFLDDPDQFKVQSDLSVAPGPDAGMMGSDEGVTEDGEKRSERRTNRNRDEGSSDDRRSTSRGEKRGSSERRD